MGCCKTSVRTQKQYRWSERSYRAWDQIAKYKSNWDRASFPHQGKINENADLNKRKETIEKLSSERNLLEGNWRYTLSHSGEFVLQNDNPGGILF